MTQICPAQRGVSPELWPRLIQHQGVSNHLLAEFLDLAVSAAKKEMIDFWCCRCSRAAVMVGRMRAAAGVA